MSYDDNYDEEYDYRDAGYEITMTDPGGSLIALTLLVCLVGIVTMPCLLSLGSWIKRSRRSKPGRSVGTTVTEVTSSSSQREGNEGDANARSRRTQSTADTTHKSKNSVAAARNVNKTPTISGDIAEVHSQSGAVELVSLKPDGAASSSRLSKRNLEEKAAADAQDSHQDLARDPYGWMTNGLYRDFWSAKSHRMDSTTDYDTAKESDRSVRGSLFPVEENLKLRRHHRRPNKVTRTAWSETTSIVNDQNESVIAPAASDDGVEAVQIQPGKEPHYDWWRLSFYIDSWHYLLDLAFWDRESRRLAKLAIPYTISVFLEGIFEIIVVALVAHYIGTEALAAWTIVDLILCLVEDFVGGIVDAVSILATHADSAENFYLVGQYCQISIIIYVVVWIPFFILLIPFMDDIILWFGFDETTAQMGKEFAVPYMIETIVAGADECHSFLLEIIGYERYATIFTLIDGAVGVAVVWIVFIIWPNTTLFEIALVFVVLEVLSITANLAYTIKKGWIKKYLPGMIGNNAFKNRAAVKRVIKTSFPLMIGGLLEDGEWEVLVLFASHMGPAEVTAWALLGDIWDVIDDSSSAVADAGEVRCGHHLAAGRPQRARMTAHKALFLSTFAALFGTSVLYILGEDMVTWLTPDPVLQQLIIDALPLIGIGNVVLNAGNMTWALVGSQGRYGLATIISFVTGWVVTLPLAAAFTYCMNLNLQGLAAAIVMSEVLTGVALFMVLVLSDWEEISRKLVEKNAVRERNQGSNSLRDDGSINESISTSGRSCAHPCRAEF